MPYRHLPARLAKNPAPQVENKVAFLGDGNEITGGDEPAFGVIPAHQRLEAANAAIYLRDNRLVIHHQAFRKPVSISKRVTACSRNPSLKNSKRALPLVLA